MRVNIRAVGEPVLVGTGSVDLEVFVPPPEPLALPPGLQHGWKGHPIRRRHTENNANVELQYYPRFGSGSGTISPPPGFASRSSQVRCCYFFTGEQRLYTSCYNVIVIPSQVVCATHPIIWGCAEESTKGDFCEDFFLSSVCNEICTGISCSADEVPQVICHSHA